MFQNRRAYDGDPSHSPGASFQFSWNSNVDADSGALYTLNLCLTTIQCFASLGLILLPTEP